MRLPLIPYLSSSLYRGLYLSTPSSVTFARPNATFLQHKLSMVSASSSNANASLDSALQVKFLSEHAVLPCRGSDLSAGFDLSSAEETVIPANGKGIVKTDLSIACPPGTYARIAPRSGLAVKKFIDCGAGVVDADYRGPVGVVLFNFGTQDFEVKRGDRIAQLILEKICMASAVKVEELMDTERGGQGFGSTGISTNASLSKKRSLSSPVSEDDVTPEETVISELLGFIHDFEEAEADNKLRGELKKLALSCSKGLICAKKEYDRTQDKNDFMETIKILCNIKK